MEQIITRLIEARQNAGLSLEDIQKRTKIPLHQLEHLESFEFDKIGPIVYTKGFIRRYAQEVNINPDTLWENDATQPSPASVRSTRHKKQPMNVNFAPVLRVIAVLILIGVVGILIRAAVLTYFEPAPPAPPNVPPQDQPDPGNGTGQDEEDPLVEPEPQVTIEQIQADESGAVYTVKNTDKLDIVLTFTGNCWTRVTVGGERILEGTFRQGDQEQFTAANLVLIRFGAPKFVSVTVNGIEIETPNIQAGYNLELRLEE